MGKMYKCVYCLQEHDGACKKEDLEKALDHYETKKFMNQMIDHWTCEDSEFDAKMSRCIREIKERLEVIVNDSTDSNN
jgi:polyhydroxyalkanoate synthesis regulator phasin